MTTPQTPTRSATTKENMTATSTGLIYVSRLLTDRAMEHLHSLGAPVRVGREAPPSRAELQAGIAGASAAVSPSPNASTPICSPPPGLN